MKMTWNAGGWFGSQFGLTCWMGLSGLMCLGHDTRTALAVLALFAATNVVGISLWRQRDQRSCYRAIQILLIVTGISGALTIFAVDRAGIWESIQIGSGVPAAPAYGVLAAMIVGLLVLFRVRFGREA